MRMYSFAELDMDEGYPPKNGKARFEGSRRPSGRSPRGVPLYSTSFLFDILCRMRERRHFRTDCSSPAKMFFEEIEVDGHRMRRFEQVG